MERFNRTSYIYREGQKVIYIPEDRVYDFGYYSQTEGVAVIYEEGEKNMQDSYAVKLENLKPVR